jgi:hypothetical protein
MTSAAVAATAKQTVKAVLSVTCDGWDGARTGPARVVRGRPRSKFLVAAVESFHFRAYPLDGAALHTLHRHGCVAKGHASFELAVFSTLD